MFKILSKQNCGVALTLLLTILLSQTNIMNLFFDTILGRIGLLIIIFGISYTNHLLGIASTFFVIMLFACCYNYSENFETVDTTSSSPLSPLSDSTPLSDDSDNNKYMVTEGFDILGTERILQRGKKSNTILVNEDMRKSENPAPYDGWLNQSYFTSIF
jgi:hypothetical protein